MCQAERQVISTCVEPRLTLFIGGDKITVFSPLNPPPYVPPPLHVLIHICGHPLLS